MGFRVKISLFVAVLGVWSGCGCRGGGEAPKKNLEIDCYYGSVEKNKSESSCKEGYFVLPQEVLQQDVNGNKDVAEDVSNGYGSWNGVLCCPKGTRDDERLTRINLPFLWPNEQKGTLTRAFMSCRATNIPGLDTIRFLLYTKKTLGLFDYEEIFVNNLQSLIQSSFMKEAPLKVIIHGFMSSAFVGPAPTLRYAYSKVPDHLNIIAVHWEALANIVTASDGICYDIASKSTKYVGRKTAQMIEFLIKNNFTTLDKVHILGHSLGNHCAGFAGKYLKIGKLPRVTAFDPARPTFDGKPPSERLDFTDAEFVDVIHTATTQWRLLGTITFGFLPFPVGIKDPMGHSDFYPNYGTHQPGCYFQFHKLPVLCSHSRSYFYYADSIRYRDQREFLAKECDSLNSLENENCESNGTQIVMGEYTPKFNNTRKLFYVKTNSKSPFPVSMIETV